MAGPIIVSSGGAATGYARSDYRWWMGRRAGPFVRFQTLAVADGDERRRHVILDRMIDDEGGLDQYKGHHVYVMDGDQAGHQARVLSSGFAGPHGLLELSSAMSGVLAAGVTIEVSGSLPAESYGTWDGLNDIINDALGAFWVRDRLSFTGDATYAVALDDSPWLRSTDQVVGLVDALGSATGNPVAASTSWRIRHNGSSRTLETDLAYSTGDAYQLEVYRPADTLIKSGTWGSGSGLNSETDEAAVPVYLLGTIGLAMLYQRLAARAQWDEGLAPSLPQFERQYRRWGRAAQRLKWEDGQQEAEPYPLVSGGYRAVGDKGLWSMWG